MPKLIKIALISLLLSVSVVLYWFSKVPADEFLFMHDQLLQFSREAVKETFFVRSASNIGVANGLSSILSTWHLLIYYVLYSLGLSIRGAEIVSFSLYLFATIFLSFLGFWNLKKFLNWETSDVFTFLLSLFYTFNTYTLIMWHTGNYSANFALTYSLFPLMVYYLAKIIENKKTLVDLIFLAITIFAMSFYLATFGVAILFFVCAILLGLILRPKNAKSIFKSLFVLLLLYLPLAAYVIVTIFYEFFNISGALNENPVNSYTMLKGGILYPILMRFSWAIYTKWEVKNIFTYDGFFTDALVNLSFFSVFFVLCYLTLRNKLKGVIAYSAFLFLLISVFLAKGAQYPFGYIYLFLYKNIPLFNVFRSPESKFAIGIILSISVLFLYFAQYYKSKLLLFFVALTFLIQSYPLIGGAAIIGKGKDDVDRSIKITETYNNLSGYLKSDGTDNITVLILPPNLFGYFKTSDGFSFIGQDPIRKLSNANFVYPNASFGIYKSAFNNIETSVKSGDIEFLGQLGISHILLRRDSVSRKYTFPDDTLLRSYMDLVYEDDQFSLYKFRNVAPLIEGGDIKYKRVSPVKYYVHVNDYEPGYEIRFLNSYHSGWDLYKNEGDSGSWLADIKYLFAEPVPTHVPTPKRFFNSWTINRDYPSDLDLVMYFKPQSYTYLGLVVSLLTLLTYLGYVSYVSISKRKG